MSDYKRLVLPDGIHRVDVPNWLIPDKLAQGYTIDTEPDTREEISSVIGGRHPGATAFVLASGPSAALHSTATLQEFVRKHNAVVWTVNDAWRVVGGLPMPVSNYHVVLDSEHFDLHRANHIEYLYRTKSLLCCAFDPPTAIQHYRININLGALPEQDPPYQYMHYWHPHSSGVASAVMAMHCGVSRIYLLGHDCTTAGTNTHGFGKRHDGELRQNYPQGQQMLVAYALLAKHAKQLGIDIYNISPISAIKSFPVLTLDQAMKDT